MLVSCAEDEPITGDQPEVLGNLTQPVPGFQTIGHLSDHLIQHVPLVSVFLIYRIVSANQTQQLFMQ